jgi:hypothetical protein
MMQQWEIRDGDKGPFPLMKCSDQSGVGSLWVSSTGFLPAGSGHAMKWMFGVNFRQAGYRIDRSFLVSEFRFRTKIALPIHHPGTELTYESVI